MTIEEVEILNDNILRVADLLEQIQDVNRMIELHQGDDDLLMHLQYQHRKAQFLLDLPQNHYFPFFTHPSTHFALFMRYGFNGFF